MLSPTPLWNNTYRIASARKTGWNYDEAGAYFLTWCVKDRLSCLSQITHNVVSLSNIGKIVDEEWHETGVRRSNIQLDAWVIMPNHVHGILFIHNDAADANRSETTSGLITQSLGAIISQVKSACTKRIWANGNTSFAWQPRFHDRILRNERELNAARTYIANNPSRWELDRNNDTDIFM